MAKPKRTRKVVKRSGEDADYGSAEAETWTLMPDDEIRDLIKRGMAATGSKRQTLIFELIRQELPNLIKKKREERLAAEQSFDIPGSADSGEEK